MSTNIKTNPFYLTNEFAIDGWDYIITNNPGGTDVKKFIDVIIEYMNSILYNASMISKIDNMKVAEISVGVINTLTTDSWCKDCCDNTFNSYKNLKEKIELLGIYTPAQLTYINQIIAMPCNYNISNLNDFESILSQLETSILIDQQLSPMDKAPVLMVLQLSLAARYYWYNQAITSGLWVTPFMTPPPAIDYVRPLWLMSILGSIVSSRMVQTSLITDYNSSLAIQGVIGALTASTSYAVFKA
jgi:hypothetical protein